MAAQGNVLTAVLQDWVIMNIIKDIMYLTMLDTSLFNTQYRVRSEKSKISCFFLDFTIQI